MLKKIKAVRRKRREKRELRESIKLRANALELQLQYSALNCERVGVASNQPLPLIVSLTSHGKRVQDVYLTIESLLQQSHKPDKIVLWLSAQDFDHDDLPATLRLQMRRGLEVEFVEEDLGPYTKFYYALKKYPDSLILTVDDDILYPADIVDELYRAYLKQPDMIHCGRAHEMAVDERGEFTPYKSWFRSSQEQKVSLLLFPTGVGGVLYFPGCFDPEIFNKEAFEKLAPRADDIWLKAMSLKKGTMCHVLEGRGDWMCRFPTLNGSQGVSLKRQNKKLRTGNDSQLKAVFEKYGLMPKILDLQNKKHKP